MTTPSSSPAPSKRAEPRRESLLADFSLTPVSDEDRHKAALAVCARSETADEARELLEALGLLGDRSLRKTA